MFFGLAPKPWSKVLFPGKNMLSDIKQKGAKRYKNFINNRNLFCCCWLAAWRSSYREAPWQLNHFVVTTLYQQQHIGFKYEFTLFKYQHTRQGKACNLGCCNMLMKRVFKVPKIRMLLLCYFES